MRRCVRDGQLKAFVDQELPELDSRRVAAHVADCEQCARQLDQMRTATFELDQAMASLAPADCEQITPPAILRTSGKTRLVAWHWAAAATTAAAVFLAMFVSHSRQTNVPGDRSPTEASLDRPSLSAGLPVETPVAPLSKAARIHSQQHADEAAIDSKPLMRFVALNPNEPIENGTVMRVKLPAAMFSNVNPAKTPEITADAIVDEQGRVRAIRVLGSNGSAKE